jgi:hypothetical protein
MLNVRFERESMLTLRDRNAPLDVHRTATHWQCCVALAHDALRCTDPIPVLGAVMDAIQGFGPRNDEIYMVVSTLFARALEQGLLGLDARLKCDQNGFASYYHQLEEKLTQLDNGRIEIGFVHTPDAEGGLLEITVTEIWDEPERSRRPRHIDDGALETVRALCATLNFNADGRQAVAAYRWYKESTLSHRPL